MKKILGEPLVHFLIAGALLFALYALVSARTSAPETIVIGPGQIDMLAGVFERTWQRKPAPEEVKHLVDAHVREEILYREGVAMKLDRDDQLIRRRVRQRVEFFAESSRGIPEPDDAALQTYLDAHGKQFASPARVTFRQVYLGAAAGPETAALLAQLSKLGDSDAVENLGRATQLEAKVALASPADVERLFGRRFAQALDVVPPGEWRGPLASEYGLHLVRVSERVAGRPPVLGEVRELVKRDWLRDQMAAANEKYYEGLRARYTVRIDDPRVSPAP